MRDDDLLLWQRRNPVDVTASLLTLRVHAKNTVATDPRRTCMGSDKACAHAARSIALLLVKGDQQENSLEPWALENCMRDPREALETICFFACMFARHVRTWLDHFHTSFKKAFKANAMKFDPFVRPGWMAQSHECRANTRDAVIGQLFVKQKLFVDPDAGSADLL
jgi:hypothetical protein